jgi:hypothetical protein
VKRIVNGTTYNTQTSTVLAEKPWGDPSPTNTSEDFGIERLYQTRGGAFFLDEEVTCRLYNQDEREWTEREDHTFRPISAERANEWLLEGEVEVFHNPFEDPPEATAEAEPGAILYVRMPAALKHRVDEAAGKDKVSGNVWAMRCLEDCLDGDFPREFGRIWGIARGLTAPWSTDKIGGADDEYKLKTAITALGEIGDLVEEFAKKRYGTNDLAKLAEGDVNAPEYRPYPE